MTKIQELERTLRALGSLRRLQIIKYLKKNKTATVGKLAREIRIQIFTTSQHLRVLRSAGIVTYKRSGKYVIYRLLSDQKPFVQSVLKEL
jgi:DNA-binding transcriptional ArsR family regulator